MKKEYTQLGRCIWCSKERPEVTFFDRPHTISRQLGSNTIGVDICDSCNRYFGTRDRKSKYSMSVELAFKEIFNVSRYLMPDSEGKVQVNRLKSIYFEYFKSQNIFRIKSTFKFQREFLSDFTRQFKRGVYEVFLQELHRQTGKGLDVIFDDLRKFVRFDRGDLPLYFADNNGIYLLPENRDEIFIAFENEQLETIQDYGFYNLWFFGHVFYLLVTPKAHLSKDVFLRKLSRQIHAPGFIYSSIREMQYVTDLDFTYRKLYNNNRK
jgi:hypothetical protein